jgi:hypothetical protein
MWSRERLADAWLMIGTWSIVVVAVAFSAAPVVW